MTNWETNMCSTYYKGIVSLIYKQLLQINKRKSREMGKGYEQAFHRKENVKDNHMKRDSTCTRR